MTKPDQFEFKLDLASGVPVYRQIIDQVLRAVATGALVGGVQLPTVRQASVDLAINPNTVLRAYRELELRGVITTQQGIGTFVTLKQVELNQAEREARLDRLAALRMPFLRRKSSAFSRSPPTSARARLQSIMPALVLSRRVLTS